MYVSFLSSAVLISLIILSGFFHIRLCFWLRYVTGWLLIALVFLQWCGEIFLGVWRTFKPIRLQDTGKVKCLIHTNRVVVCWRYLVWVQHPISYQVSFLYISDKENTQADPDVLRNWPNQEAGIQAGWRQKEVPASGKARKPMQFSLKKYVSHGVIERKPKGVLGEGLNYRLFPFWKLRILRLWPDTQSHREPNSRCSFYLLVRSLTFIMKRKCQFFHWKGTWWFWVFLRSWSSYFIGP